MESDAEFDAWRRQWQAASPAAVDARGLVDRGTRRMHWTLAAQILVTLVWGGGSLLQVELSRRTGTLTLAIGVWVFLAIAWAMALRLRRGTWAPMTQTTAAFLDLATLRCRRRRQAVVAQAGLYVALLTFDLVWIYVYGAEPRVADPWAFLSAGDMWWVWGVTAVLAVYAFRRWRALTRECENLATLQQENGRRSVGEVPGELPS